MSLETVQINNRLYTKRENLKNWEGNLKTITRDEVDTTKRLRTEYVEIESFLVMPDSDHFLVLGGNTRNIADAELGKELEPIEIIEFEEIEGRWWVYKDGKVHTDKKSFATKKEAMTAYSMLHNARLSGYDKEAISLAIEDPDLGELALNDVFVQVGDPISLSDKIDKWVPTPEAAEGANPDQINQSETAAAEQPMLQNTEEEKPPIPEQAVLTECPDCGAVFDPKKHPAKNNAVEGDIEKPSDFL